MESLYISQIHGIHIVYAGSINQIDSLQEGRDTPRVCTHAVSMASTTLTKYTLP